MAGVVPSDTDIILSLGEDLPVGLWVARAPHGELVYTNKTFAAIMGIGGLGDVQAGGYAEPYGICTRELAPYPEQRMPFVRALEEQRVVVCDDITIRRADGTCVDVRAFANPVGSPPTHVVIAFFDVTREVQADRARQEADRRLEAAQRLEAVGTLAGGIAHDFNNLICGIKLIAADLASSETHPKRLEGLNLIDNITERSAALTQSLLGFARRGKHRSELLVLDDVLASMTELLRRTLVGVVLEFDLAAGREGCVIGDASQLEQVVMNLVVNARDAVAGSGQVSVRTLRVGDSIVLEVADDGPGIPAELRARVFEPYFTTKTKGSDRGTGLGLATVFGIAQLHFATCEIDDGLGGRGATIRLRFPLAAPSPRRRAGGARVIPVPPPTPASGMVLIVDDDPVVRHAVAAAVGALGYDVLEAHGGAQALALHTEHREAVTAVLLDMTMPGMNGKATYLALRELHPTLPVLLMSGYTHDEEVQEILDLGVRGFIAKPYSIDGLYSALSALHTTAE